MLDAYVIGHGIPELAAALELAEVGLRVRVGVPAGLAASQLDTAVLDTDAPEAAALGSGAHSGAAAAAPDRGALDPSGVLRAFLAHVAGPIAAEAQSGQTTHGTAAAGADATSDDAASTHPSGAFAAAAPVTCATSRTLLRGAKRDWQALPEPNVWGVPAVPMSTDSIALLGGRGALRASVDRVRPVLTIGKTTELGALVRSRMGQQMLDRVVDPLVRARFGVDANGVDVAVAAPGLNGALTVAGSLSGAVLTEAEEHAAREALVRPAAGWQALRAALIERLSLYGVQFGAAVTEVVELDASTVGARTGSPLAHLISPHWRAVESGGEFFDAVAVIVGVPAMHVMPTVLHAFANHSADTRWRATLSAVAQVTDLPAGLEHAAAATVGAPAAAAAQGSGVESGASGDRDEVAITSDSLGWTVRYERVTPHEWRVTAEGPAESAQTDSGQGSAGAGLQAVRDEHPALAHAAVDWQLAPWAQAQPRDDAAEALAEERLEHAWQLRVGRGLHAGDLAAAVDDARRAAVHLRRRLTGISD